MDRPGRAGHSDQVSPAKKTAPADAVRVYLETGKSWTFAGAIDWPGWCRRGKGEEGALEALSDYERRYKAVVGRIFRTGPMHVVGRLPGTATTDFGAPDVKGPWDEEAVDQAQADRLATILER